MNPSKKVFLCFLTLAAIAAAGFALAQETTTVQENSVSLPKLLPDSKFYFLKNWQRGLESLFTFDTVKKAELGQKFVAERLTELRILAEKSQDSQVIKNAASALDREIENLKNQADKIQDQAKDNPRVKQFLDKFVDQSILQQKLLERLESRVPAQAFEKIAASRQKHLQKFGEVMTKLEDKNQMAETIKQALEKQPETGLKSLRDLQFLQSLKDKLPLQVIESLKAIEEDKFQKLKTGLEKMSAEQQSKLIDRLQTTGGDKEKQLQILESLKAGIQKSSLSNPEAEKLQKKIEEGRDKVINKIENAPTKTGCPAWLSPVPDFCKAGRVVVNKDANGCLLPAKCVVVEDGKSACTTLWDPVCGSNGQTYSNSCFAKMDNASVVSRGVCPEKQEKPPVPAENP